jgi:phosphoglycolate phosphatase
MKQKQKIKGIIFDMDNTLLRSRIDFEAMKNETFQFLTSHGVLSSDIILSDYTTSTIIEEAVRTNRMMNEVLNEMWEIPKKHEVLGMQDADLEPGVIYLLDELLSKYIMVIVTNNSIDAAERALKENGIFDYFDCVVGREMMKSLKPSPDGFLYILNQYKNTSAIEWISVGDAWIDGKASVDAGIKFISYQGNTEKMNIMGVYPSAKIMNITELIDFV